MVICFSQVLWVARLLIKETQSIWRLDALWFGVKDRFDTLLEFLFLFYSLQVD